MGFRDWKLWAAAGLALGAGVAFWAIGQRTVREPVQPYALPGVAEKVRLGPGTRADAPALAPVPVNQQSSTERSPLADGLNAPESNLRKDLEIVYGLLKSYRERFRAFPAGGENAEFVNALTGNNRERLALLPRDHEAINGQGELVDRWQSPFFFHQLSREAMEVRSAGPDRVLWTEDDVVVGRGEVNGPGPDAN